MDSVAQAYWEGLTPEAIVDEWPALTLEQVHGAIAFYLGNRQEIDRFLSEQGVVWEQVRRGSEAAHGPLLERLRSSGRVAPSKGGTD